MRMRVLSFYVLMAAAGVLGYSWMVKADPPGASATAKDQGKDGEKQDDKRMTVAEARERARMMHKIYASTLDVMHHHYFRENRSVLPARAMEDIFEDIDAGSKIKARWISVNTPAMSIQHQPKTAFEKKAAAVISAGEDEYARVEDGYYIRAGVIPLGAGCVGCHTRFFQRPPETPRVAGLVIAIPVRDE